MIFRFEDCELDSRRYELRRQGELMGELMGELRLEPPKRMNLALFENRRLGALG